MNILILSTGTQRRCLMQKKYLEKEGLNVTISIPNNPLHKLPRGKAVINRTLQKILIPDLDAITIPITIEKIKSIHPDIILVSLPPFSLLLTIPKLARQAPVVLDYRDPWLESYSYRPHPIDREIQERAMRHASAIITPNPYWYTIFRERYQKHKSIIHNISNGYDPEDFKDLPRKVRNQKMIWSWIGTLLPEHDTTIIEQINEYSKQDLQAQIQIRIAGRLSPSKLKKILKNRNIEIQVEGNLSHKEAINLMHQSDALILPPTLHREGIPSRTPEYIRSGTPILSNTRSTMTRELIKKTRSGIVATRPENIYMTINRWYMEWQYGRPILKEDRNLKPLEEYNWKENVKKLNTILEEIA